MPKQRRTKKLPFKPFDVTTKQLVETDPAAWLEYAGFPIAPVEVIDADLSAVTVAADKVIRVDAIKPYLLNLEFMSTYELTLRSQALHLHN